MREAEEASICVQRMPEQAELQPREACLQAAEGTGRVRAHIERMPLGLRHRRGRGDGARLHPQGGYQQGAVRLPHHKVGRRGGRRLQRQDHLHLYRCRRLRRNRQPRPASQGALQEAEEELPAEREEGQGMQDRQDLCRLPCLPAGESRCGHCRDGHRRGEEGRGGEVRSACSPSISRTAG